MKLIVYIAFLLLVSCGSGTVQVTYIETEKQEIDAMCDSGNCDGFAEWDFFEGTCTIWMMSRETYYSDQKYHEVLGHEMRHCLEGGWHE